MRRFIALALLVVAARWLTRQKAAQPDFDALETELEQAVAEEIEWRLGSYLDAGQAELVTHAYPDVVSVWFEVLPKNPDAARISVSVSGDEVVAGIGHGVVDLFAEPRGSWQRQLGEILQAVADGRFQERISEGWMWQRKIEMSFPGTELGSARYSGSPTTMSPATSHPSSERRSIRHGVWPDRDSGSPAATAEDCCSNDERRPGGSG